MPTQRWLFLPWVSPSTPLSLSMPLSHSAHIAPQFCVVGSLQQVGISEAKVRSKHSPVAAFQLSFNK